MKRWLAILGFLGVPLLLMADVTTVPSGGFFTALRFDRTLAGAGVTGNQTQNKLAGVVRIAAAGATVTVTNGNVTASSICFATVQTNDGTALLKNAVPGAGSLVITMNAAVTAETAVAWTCTN